MKQIYFIILLLYANSLFAQKETVISLKSKKAEIETLQKRATGFQLKCNFSSLLLTSKNTSEGVFEDLQVNGLTKIYDKGNPGIPVVSKLIEIPIGATYEVRIISYDEEIVDLKEYGINGKIAPAQQSVSKSDDTKQLKFDYNKDIYKQNKFIEKEIATVENIGIMRGTRLGRLEINPIQYNPGGNKIKILNNLIVEVKFSAGNGVKEEDNKKFQSPCFQEIIDNSVVNTHESAKALLGDSPIKYVIISDPMFKEALQPFIQWKTKKGFIVEARYTDETAVGSTTSSIKSFLKNIYTSPADGIPHTFLLLVGDVGQIPAFPGEIWGYKHVSDLYYEDYTGDSLPDVFCGRFSATSVSELKPQIDKTLQVDQMQMPDKSYLREAILVAGVDEEMSSVWANGAINYANTYYTNAANAINSKYYLYNDSSGVMASNNPAASASIIEQFNKGASFVNYSAHGYNAGWYEPSFGVSDLESLSNKDKYPLVISNCCMTSKFEGLCFAEEMLRAENKGAVGYIGGTSFTLWDEDYWWVIGLTSNFSANPRYDSTGLGAFDQFFHLKGEDKSNWNITLGQMLVAGNLTVEASSSEYKNYYWEIYHLMGDPSLTPPVSVPTTLNVTHPGNITIGESIFTVSVEKYAYVAISMNGVLIDAKLSNESNKATFSIGNLSTPGNLDIVVTKQNKIPYIAQIPVSAVDLQAPSVPTDLSVSNIEQTSLTLTWTASTDNVGVTGYDIYKNGNILVGTSVGTCDTITGLTCNTNYVFTVKAKDQAGNVSAPSNQLNITPLCICNYCPSVSNRSSYEYIKEVKVDRFINSSGATNYSDFKNQIITLVRNQATSFTLTPGFSGSVYNEYFRIYIDLNSDCDFDDAGEMLYDAGSAKTTAVTGTIIIPLSAKTGLTRIRVSMRYIDAPTQCLTGLPYGDGEVEDYSVRILSGGPGLPQSKAEELIISLFSNPSNGVFKLAIPSGVNDDAIINVYNMDGQLVYTKIVLPNGNPLEVPMNVNVAAGVYSVQVITNNGVISKQIIINR